MQNEEWWTLNMIILLSLVWFRHTKMSNAGILETEHIAYEVIPFMWLIKHKVRNG